MTGGLADGARGGPAQAESASTGASWAIVLAAGGGTRFGGRKQFADLAGRPMLEHTLCSASTACDGGGDAAATWHCRPRWLTACHRPVSRGSEASG